MLTRLKHWQLFFLIAVPSFWPSAGTIGFFINLFGIIVFSTWIHDIGFYGQKKIEEAGQDARSTTSLKACCQLIPMLYVILVVFYNPLSVTDSMEYIMVPVAIAFCFATLYVLVFAAKTLAQLNPQNKLRFRSTTMNFLMLMITPIGVWIIQPKLNQLK